MTESGGIWEVKIAVIWDRGPSVKEASQATMRQTSTLRTQKTARVRFRRRVRNDEPEDFSAHPVQRSDRSRAALRYFPARAAAAISIFRRKHSCGFAAVRQIRPEGFALLSIFGGMKRYTLDRRKLWPCSR